ncbi:MAG TPA: hypothetical protein VIY48_07825 [Candidatus Paceibacterota bacterium]
MPYVDRDAAGNIVSEYSNQQHDGQEWVDIIIPSKQQQHDAIQAQIDHLERESLMNRMLREFALGQMESSAIAFGAAQTPALNAADSLAYAYANNIAYKKTKDLDIQITALRTQMDAIV